MHFYFLSTLHCYVYFYWLGRSVPIVTQNINGPCPLIAIVNVLFLKEKITLDPSVEIVTSSQLMGYLGDIVLQATPQVSFYNTQICLLLVQQNSYEIC